MDCQRCREIVSADLDREATAEESLAAEAHLDGCPGCRDWVGRAAAVTRRARTRLVVEAPDLVDGVRRALEHGWVAREEPQPALLECPEPARRLVLLGGGEAGTTECGCLATCGCGCQQGRSCRCGGHRAA